MFKCLFGNNSDTLLKTGLLVNFCGGSDRLVLVNQVKFAENLKLVKKPGLFNRIVFSLVITFLSLHHFIHNVNLISYGIWKIMATYADTFETTATAEFEVKEYGKTLVFYIVFLKKVLCRHLVSIIFKFKLCFSVLPSILLHIEPEANYISEKNYESFKLTISAK